MSTFDFSCPLCGRTFSGGIDHWSWPFVYSRILIHLDSAHGDVAPPERKVTAERIADEIAADQVRRRLLRGDSSDT